MFKYNKKNNLHIISIKYDENIISHKTYNEMILKCKEWYDSKIKEIYKEYDLLLKNKNYNDSLNISRKHKKIVIRLIHKILKYYPIINNIQFGIFISNSFARGTNLIDSDFDLNFVYEDKEIGFQIEEQISYALSKITGKYRDFIHDSITHRTSFLPEYVDYEEDDRVIFVNNWDNYVDRYEITKGNEKLILKYCFNNRNISSYIKYFSFYVNSDEINEWVYYHDIIFGNKYVKEIFKSIIKKEREILKLPFYEKDSYELINKIKKDFLTELQTFDNVDFYEMQNFKKYFKNMTYNKIFTTIALLKKNSTNKLNFKDVKNFFDTEKEYKDYENKVLNYFGNIMQFNYICDKYGIEFRTRYSNRISKDFIDYYKKESSITKNFILYFKSLSKDIYIESIKVLDKTNNFDINQDTTIFDCKNEYININNYSPFSYINDVSIEYQKKSFMLPFIKKNNKKVPVHPDTFEDLNLNRKDIIEEKLVYPTSSYRTVYDPTKNICYKLVLLRKITRSIRNLPKKELDRSMIASKLISKYKFESFNYIREFCFYNEDENFNYIIRKMPKVKTYPWFYVISSLKFDKDFQLKCITNIIKSWMFFASKGVYFESPHTQNYLVDKNANIYYRDLSDVRNLDYEIMIPSFYKQLSCDGEMLSVFFDRAICNQNLDHLIKYCKDINEDDVLNIKKLIISEIKKYNLPFPNYSMDYSKDKNAHIPMRIEKVKYR